MDCTASLLKTGLNVVPPFDDFHTPPLADPTYTVSRPSSFTAAIADTRPLIVAEPMFRAPSPEMESESNFASCAAADPATIVKVKLIITAKQQQRIILLISRNSSEAE
jgi:hypothetical protein